MDDARTEELFDPVNHLPNQGEPTMAARALPPLACEETRESDLRAQATGAESQATGRSSTLPGQDHPGAPALSVLTPAESHPFSAEDADDYERLFRRASPYNLR
jgi:hypothetical protein